MFCVCLLRMLFGPCRLPPPTYSFRFAFLVVLPRVGGGNPVSGWGTDSPDGPSPSPTRPLLASNAARGSNTVLALCVRCFTLVCCRPLPSLGSMRATPVARPPPSYPLLAWMWCSLSPARSFTRVRSMPPLSFTQAPGSSSPLRSMGAPCVPRPLNGSRLCMLAPPITADNI